MFIVKCDLTRSRFHLNGLFTLTYCIYLYTNIETAYMDCAHASDSQASFWFHPTSCIRDMCGSAPEQDDRLLGARNKQLIASSPDERSPCIVSQLHSDWKAVAVLR